MILESDSLLIRNKSEHNNPPEAIELYDNTISPYPAKHKKVRDDIILPRLLKCFSLLYINSDIKILNTVYTYLIVIYMPSKFPLIEIYTLRNGTSNKLANCVLFHSSYNIESPCINLYAIVG